MIQNEKITILNKMRHYSNPVNYRIFLLPSRLREKKCVQKTDQ